MNLQEFPAIVTDISEPFERSCKQGTELFIPYSVYFIFSTDKKICVNFVKLSVV